MMLSKVVLGNSPYVSFPVFAYFIYLFHPIENAPDLHPNCAV